VDMIGEQDTMVHNMILQRLVSDTYELHAATRCTVAAGGHKLIGAGCNGQNDNCDQYLVIDECAEDGIPPVIKLSPTSLPQWFHTKASVEAAVAAMVSITDDCNAITGPTVALTTLPTTGCAASNVHVHASDACGNVVDLDIPVKLDIAPPNITCAVAVTYLINVDNLLHNVGFTYNVTDNCGTGVVTTRLALLADEQVESGFTPQGYIQRTHDGQYKGILLRASNGYNSNGRVYTIIATATNAAGLSASCNQTVGVKYYTAPPLFVNDGPYFLVTNCNNVDI